MKSQKKETNTLSNHFFRHSYAKIVAVLVKYFGLHQVELAEDIVQDTLLTAMEQWSIQGIPNNPEGWLIDVAKKKTINILRRNQLLQQKIIPKILNNTNHYSEIEFTNEIIDNSTLRMLFTCCHPKLPVVSQIALGLKTLCGFSIPEISDALLTNEATINKRLYRAKKKFRIGEIPFKIPNSESLFERIKSVCSTIYLLFNEGYYSKSNSQIIRKELCFEAIRLQEILVEAFPNSNESRALLALMYIQFARIESRIDNNGILITLSEQNRDLWDKELIQMGIIQLTKSLSKTPNSYQIQAGIATEHALATSFESTNWKNIYQQYQILESLDNNPVILFNKEIARFFLGEQKEAIKNINLLYNKPELANTSLVFASLSNFHAKTGNHDEAKKYYKKALELSSSEIEKKSIKQSLNNINL